MGMFDNLRSNIPLPGLGLSDREFQTKDTPDQFLSSYEIREDGTLWVEKYDLEKNPDYDGKSMFGMLRVVNKRYEPANFTGTIRFYDPPYDFLATVLFDKVISVVEYRPSIDLSTISLKTMYRQKDTGGMYRVIMHGEMSDSGADAVVYQSMKTGKILISHELDPLEFTPIIQEAGGAQ